MTQATGFGPHARSDGATIERRMAAGDRRGRLAFSVLYGGMRPRRRAGRRAADHHRPIVDWHSPELLASCVLLLILCVADALLTVHLIASGAVEANPFMALFVYGDLREFAILKLAITGAGVVTLVAVARFRVFRYLRAATLVHALLLAYVVLVYYEIELVARVA